MWSREQSLLSVSLPCSCLHSLRHCWLSAIRASHSTLCPPGSPGSFPHSSSSASVSPAVSAQGHLLSQGQALHLSSLNFVRFLSACYSSLPECLWMRPTPCNLLLSASFKKGHLVALSKYFIIKWPTGWVKKLIPEGIPLVAGIQRTTHGSLLLSER